jgi:hypothetical protein
MTAALGWIKHNRRPKRRREASRDAEEPGSRRARLASTSRPFPGPPPGRLPSKPPPSTDPWPRGACPWGSPRGNPERPAPKTLFAAARRASPAPNARGVHEVHERGTRDAPEVHMCRALVHLWSIPGTPHVHGARPRRAAPGVRWGLAAPYTDLLRSQATAAGVQKAPSGAACL